jgi:hypothetical protein
MLSPEEIKQKFERLDLLVAFVAEGREQTLREFRSIIDALWFDTTNGDASEKLGSAAGCAVALFSVRKQRPPDSAVTTREEKFKSLLRLDLSDAQRNIHVGEEDAALDVEVSGSWWPSANEGDDSGAGKAR